MFPVNTFCALFSVRYLNQIVTPQWYKKSSVAFTLHLGTITLPASVQTRLTLQSTLPLEQLTHNCQLILKCGPLVTASWSNLAYLCRDCVCMSIYFQQATLINVTKNPIQTQKLFFTFKMQYFPICLAHQNHQINSPPSVTGVFPQFQSPWTWSQTQNTLWTWMGRKLQGK